MEILGTPIKFHECYSMVKRHKVVGVHRARVHVHLSKAPFLVKEKRTIELKHSYIYDFGPRQCNQAVPASSKSADALA